MIDIILSFIFNFIELIFVSTGQFIYWNFSGRKGSFNDYFEKNEHPRRDGIIGAVFVCSIITAIILFLQQKGII